MARENDQIWVKEEKKGMEDILKALCDINDHISLSEYLTICKLILKNFVVGECVISLFGNLTAPLRFTYNYKEHLILSGGLIHHLSEIPMYN